MQQSEKNLLAVEQGALDAFQVLVGVGMSAASSNGGTGAPQAADGAGGKGLANPFKGKSAGEIDKMFKKKGFDPRGPDPKGGKGGYVDPKTGRSYHIDEANSFGEPPHVDVNRPKDYSGPLDKGEPVTPGHLTDQVSAYIEAAGIGKKGSCHLFRHTMATLTPEGGADIRFIQQTLGHESLTSTQLYTHVSIRKLKEIHTATHPGARLARKGEKPDEDSDASDERAEGRAQLDEEADEEGPEP